MIMQISAKKLPSKKINNKMKPFGYLLVSLIFLFSSVTPTLADSRQFCKGFKAGYTTGYKQSSGSGFDPFTPFCPFQPFKGFNDPDSDYEHGYIIGYEKGLQRGRR